MSICRLLSLRVDEAKALLLSARLAYVPSLNLLNATGTLSSYDGAKPSKIYSVPASASWQVDLFGSLSCKSCCKGIATADRRLSSAVLYVLRSLPTLQIPITRCWCSTVRLTSQNRLPKSGRRNVPWKRWKRQVWPPKRLFFRVRPTVIPLRLL